MDLDDVTQLKECGLARVVAAEHDRPEGFHVALGRITIAADEVEPEGEARAGRQRGHGVAAADRHAEREDAVVLVLARLDDGFHVPVELPVAAEESAAETMTDLVADAEHEVLEIAAVFALDELLVDLITQVVDVEPRARQEAERGCRVDAPDPLGVPRPVVEDVLDVLDVQRIQRIDLPVRDSQNCAPAVPSLTI